MLPREMPELTRGLKQQGFHITIETAGTIDKPVVCDLMSISPKLSNSDPSLERAGEDWLKRHQATRQQPEIVQALIDRYPYQLKFVVDSVEDVDEIGAYLEMITDWDPARVMLMPEGIRQDELERKEVWLKPICDQRGFQLCRRMHILWYGNRRGT